MISKLICLLSPTLLSLLIGMTTSGINTVAAQFSFDPMLDGRKEIAKYNQFMDEIFTRMNIAIKAKHLDPMDLKLLPNADKMPRTQTTFYTVNVSKNI